MRLVQANDWKAVHFNGGRVIMRKDRNLYPENTWWNLVNIIEVASMEQDGYYRVVTPH